MTNFENSQLCDKLANIINHFYINIVNAFDIKEHNMIFKKQH